MKTPPSRPARARRCAAGGPTRLGGSPPAAALATAGWGGGQTGPAGTSAAGGPAPPAPPPPLWPSLPIGPPRTGGRAAALPRRGTGGRHRRRAGRGTGGRHLLLLRVACRRTPASRRPSGVRRATGARRQVMARRATGARRRAAAAARQATGAPHRGWRRLAPTASTRPYCRRPRCRPCPRGPRPWVGGMVASLASGGYPAAAGCLWSRRPRRVGCPMCSGRPAGATGCGSSRAAWAAPAVPKAGGKAPPPTGGGARATRGGGEGALLSCGTCSSTPSCTGGVPQWMIRRCCCCGERGGNSGGRGDAWQRLHRRRPRGSPASGIQTCSLFFFSTTCPTLGRASSTPRGRVGRRRGVARARQSSRGSAAVAETQGLAIEWMRTFSWPWNASTRPQVINQTTGHTHSLAGAKRGEERNRRMNKRTVPRLNPRRTHHPARANPLPPPPAPQLPRQWKCRAGATDRSPPPPPPPGVILPTRHPATTLQPQTGGSPPPPQQSPAATAG